MGSPFPGMDPYIEATGLWGDFHHSLIADIKVSLARRVPERYVVRTEERFYLALVEAEGKKEHAFIPDVSVTASAKPSRKTAKKTTSALLEPVELRAFIEEDFREGFIEIFDTIPELRLVTTIEVLSPSNKRRGTAGWDEYLRKRQAAMLGGVHLVELDLLRGGDRMPMLDPWPNFLYTLLVARASKSHVCKVWPGHYRHRLPVIPVPLVKPDADMLLDLQPLIETIYQTSRYDRSIDYAEPLKPPLASEDQAWLKQQLRARSR